MDGHRERLSVPSGTPPQQAPRRRRPSAFLAFIRGLFGLVFAIGIVGAAAAALIGWNIYDRYSADLPTLDGLRTYQPPMMSRVYAGDDRLMTELASERRIFVPFSAIPEQVKRAFIAAEDQNFYSHKGVDPFAIARAAFNDLQHVGDGRRPKGASTITQQVARNMVLGSDALNYERKIKEGLVALRLEKVLTKQRILELYLNGIYLGQHSYGVVAASQAYFDKPLDKLNVGEAAMLAALPKSPSNYNPFHFPEAAKIRRDWVLDRMVETHAITAAEAEAGKAEPLTPNTYRAPATVPGSEWFAEEVRRQLIERFGQDQTTEGGLIIHTSMDAALQGQADDALRRGLMHYDHAHGGWRGPVAHIAGVAAGGDWQDALARVPKPAGMLRNWQLAVVLDETQSGARVGTIDPGQDGVGPQPKMAEILLADLGWARPTRDNGDLGPAPHRIGEVLSRGDVVMVEQEGGSVEVRIGERRAARRSHEAKVASAVQTLTKVSLRQIPKVQGALVSLDPRTGRVLAMSGGWSANGNKFNRATQAQRQPGSSFKPFVYLTAMEQGISPSARFEDAPFSLGDWHPENYELTYGGPTPLRVALEQSLNLVTVRVAQRVGMDAVAKTAIGMHIYDAMPHVLPAALGAVETTVMREAGAYASLLQGGREIVPSLVDSVQDRDGHVIWRPTSLVLGAADPAQPPVLTDPRTQLADPQSTFQVLKMMEGVVKFGTGVPVGAGFDRPIAGKTGTTQNFNDGWFAGFTPDLVTVVWVGFDNPQSLGDKQDGAHVAGPIWHDYMMAALQDRPVLDFRVPDGVELARWGCGRHECVDAFKPDQVPGSGNNAGDAHDEIDTVSAEAPVLMVNPDPDAPAKPAPGTGVDTGVGGLY